MLILKIWSCRCPSASSSKDGFLLRHRRGSFQTKLYPFPLAPNVTSLDKLALQGKEGVVIRADGIDYDCQFVKKLDSILSIKELRTRPNEKLENVEQTLEEFSLRVSFNASSQELFNQDKENHQRVERQDSLFRQSEEQSSTTPLAKKRVRAVIH